MQACSALSKDELKDDDGVDKLVAKLCEPIMLSMNKQGLVHMKK